jgi:hypothetical protein
MEVTKKLVSNIKGDFVIPAQSFLKNSCLNLNLISSLKVGAC